MPAPPRGEAALRLAAARGAVTRRELARACGISLEIARQELLVLTRLGHLRRVGRGRAARYVVR
jgi:DeoR/GlpR family transcriptional regulator of sugar metabolism